ncbi:MAG: hypothetical protein ACI4XW_00955 [Candidatus Spyradocola sp.]
MERLTRILNRLLFPGAAAVLLSIPISAALLAYVFLCAQEHSPLSYAAYMISAYSLTITCAALVKACRRLLPAALRQPLIRRYLTDVPFRARVSLSLSLCIHLSFALLRLYSGIRGRSAWFVTLAVYYSLLACVHFLLLRHVRRKGVGRDFAAELRQYRLCGLILLAMNVALLGVVILMLTEGQGFSYEGHLIYAAALYTFYNITAAVMDVVKYRRLRSPVLSASKAVRLAAALVSMLSLETAMLAQFGQESGERFRLMMTALTGCGVCLLVLATAVVMLCRSARQLRNLKHTTETEGSP